MKTVVSITPIPLERDSRTFKQAATVARCGYRSIVVEGGHSDFGENLPFELRNVTQQKAAPERTAARRVRSDARDQSVRPQRGRLGHFVQQLLRPAKYCVRCCRFLRQYGATLVPLLRQGVRADLYYLHSYRQFPAVYFLCWRYGARFIYDAHDFYPAVNAESSRGFPFKLHFYTWLEQLCIKRAAVMVTAGEGYARLQQKQYGCRPTVVRNCHDPRLDCAPDTTLREHLQLSSKEFLVVAVGRPKGGRATQEAIDAMQQLPDDVHLAFVGTGYEPFADAVSSTSLEQRVHFVPPVKPYEVVPFIRDADAALILYFAADKNYLHSLPNSLFQSIAAGIPVLYPELPQIKRIAGEHELGISLDPRSPQSIADAVTALKTGDREKYRDNTQRARDVLNWENEERVIVGLLEQLFAKDKPHAQASATPTTVTDR